MSEDMNGFIIAHSRTGIARTMQYEGRFIVERSHGWAWRKVAIFKSRDAAISKMESADITGGKRPHGGFDCNNTETPDGRDPSPF